MASNLNDPGFVNIDDKQASNYAVNAGAHVPGIKNEDVVDYYSKWSENYDQDLNPNIYRGPQIAADICDIFFPNKQLRIIDIGSGTGFVGEYLNKHGFLNIDALEPSIGMLEKSREKGFYKNYINEPIESNKKTSIEDSAYDVLVLAGSMGEGHIPTLGLHEFVRITKSNGYIIIVMREEYLSYVAEYKDRLEPLMNDLQTNGTWSLKLRLQVPNYSFNKTGLIFVFQKN
jgi:ubiquinone/menaquinone biosynthesis C-methylase UbiE